MAQVIPLALVVAGVSGMWWLRLRKPGAPAAWLALVAAGTVLVQAVKRADRRCLVCRRDFANATDRARHERVCHVD